MSERVQLKRDGHQSVEVMVSQLTPRSVATLFDVSSYYIYIYIMYLTFSPVNTLIAGHCLCVFEGS